VDVDFKILPVNSSGLYAPGDVKKIIPTQIDGRSYVLVANNNDKLQLFFLKE